MLNFRVELPNIFDDFQSLLADRLACGPGSSRVSGGLEECDLVVDEHVVADVSSCWGISAVHGHGAEGSQRP